MGGQISWDDLARCLSCPIETGQELILQIDCGNIGKAQVTVYNHIGSTPIEVQTFEWDQVTTDRNSHQISIPSALLMNLNP